MRAGVFSARSVRKFAADKPKSSRLSRRTRFSTLPRSSNEHPQLSPRFAVIIPKPFARPQAREHDPVTYLLTIYLYAPYVEFQQEGALCMDWLRELLSRCTSFLRRRRLDEDLDQELESHIELAVEDNVRRGMTREQARTAALRFFGGVTQIKESYRTQRGLPFVAVSGSRCSLRAAQAALVTRLHSGCHRDAGPRHRREHRHFHAG